MKGMLFLLPNLLHPEASLERNMPEALAEIVLGLNGLIAESPKEGRAFLKKMGRTPIEVPQSVLNEHTTLEEIDALLIPLKKGEKWGYVADAGMPCLADPGALLVSKARDEGIAVEAVVGPSSLLLAIMLSGLPCQHFSFHGYLPQDPAALKATLKTLEKRSDDEGTTQLFIETPYRNQKMLKILIEGLLPTTKLSIACHLTAPDEVVMTKTVGQWKKASLPNLDDKPTIFLFRAAPRAT